MHMRTDTYDGVNSAGGYIPPSILSWLGSVRLQYSAYFAHHLKVLTRIDDEDAHRICRNSDSKSERPLHSKRVNLDSEEASPSRTVEGANLGGVLSDSPGEHKCIKARPSRRPSRRSTPEVVNCTRRAQAWHFRRQQQLASARWT